MCESFIICKILVLYIVLFNNKRLGYIVVSIKIDMVHILIFAYLSLVKIFFLRV